MLKYVHGAEEKKKIKRRISRFLPFRAPEHLEIM